MGTQITNNIRKIITSLRHARNRRETGLFVIEGTRAVLDTITSFEVKYLIATNKWIEENAARLPLGSTRPIQVSNEDMSRMTTLTTPQGVMAVCAIPTPRSSTPIGDDELVLALDQVQDPGNLGTIIRIADWFGITRILASSDTVDVYNPKVVQASMGAIARVSVSYVDLAECLPELAKRIPVYGTFLDGENIYTTEISRGGIIIMGNEGNGISTEVAECVTKRLLIPSYPQGRTTVESLNVSMATAIAVAEFRRRANQ